MLFQTVDIINDINLNLDFFICAYRTNLINAGKSPCGVKGGTDLW